MVVKIVAEGQFENYIRDYGNLIFSICYSMTGDYFDAEDLAQETFLSAYRSYDQFDGQNIKAWLTTIAANKCRDYLKSAARRSTPVEDVFFDSFVDPDPPTEEQVLANEAEERLRQLCSSLKEPYREVALGYFCEQKTPAEMALATGQNLRTLQTRVYRAKGMLKKLWKEEFR